MKSVDLAYLAGVLDSDGFISIRKQTPSKDYPTSETYTEFVGVGQTTPDAVALFASFFGGRVVLRKSRHENWRRIHYWVVTNKKAADCIKNLRPYLRIKAAQADLVLSLRNSKNTPKNKTHTIPTGANGGRARGINPDVAAQRAEWCRQIRSLNDTRVRH